MSYPRHFIIYRSTWATSVHKNDYHVGVGTPYQFFTETERSGAWQTWTSHHSSNIARSSVVKNKDIFGIYIPTRSISVH